MRFSYFFILFMFLLAMPTFAKITEISTNCDLSDCVSYFNIDRDLTAYVGTKASVDIQNSRYSLGDFINHIGSVNDVKIEIVDKYTIKISGSIDGASNNLWGFSLLTDYSHINSTWWNSSYQLRKNITVNKDYVKENVTNFPLLLKWDNDTNLSTYARSDGSDLVFTNDTNSKLAREIVYYNGSTGKLVAWVNTSLRTNINTTIWLYYKNTNGANESNNKAVWNGTYRTVQHLNCTTASNCMDSTNNNNNYVSSSGNMSFANDGKIFRAIYCDGNDYINFGGDASLNLSVLPFTISFWINRQTYFTGSNRFIVSKQSSDTIGWRSVSSNVGSLIFGGKLADYGFDTATEANTSTWHFIVMTYDSYNVRYYYDGYLEGTYASGTKNSNSTGSLGICDGIYTSNGYIGLIEEVRIENFNRSANWINTTYQTQNNPAGYTSATLGQQQYNEYFIGIPIFNSTTTERSLESYYIQLSTNANITNATAIFKRNGTNYQATVLKTNYSDSNLYEFNNTIYTPYLSNSSFTNETVILNWSFTITYNNGTQLNISSDNFNQYIGSFYLSTCTSGYPIALNFSIYNEESMPSLINSSFKMYGTISKNSNSKNFSFSFSGYSNYSICIFPNDTLSVNATIEYYSNTDYPLRNYYLFNSPVNNVTQSYNLYLLNATLAKKVKISVIDSSSLAVKQAIISIQRYDYTTSAYITMTMAKTDDQGTAITYLRGNDMFYKFMISKNGVLIADLAPLKIDIDAITNEGSLTLVADPTVLGEYYTFISSVAFGCVLNRTTDILRCSYADSTGDTQTLTLQVDKITPLRKTSICDTTTSSSSATLTCTIAGANGTYAYRFYAIRGDLPFMLETGSFAFTATIEWGVTGLFLTMVLFLTLSGVGIYKPEMALVMGGGALIIASVLNLMAIEILSGSIGGILVVIAILIYRMRNRD